MSTASPSSAAGHIYSCFPRPISSAARLFLQLLHSCPLSITSPSSTTGPIYSCLSCPLSSAARPISAAQCQLLPFFNLQLLDPFTAAQCQLLPFFNLQLLTHPQLLPSPNLIRCYSCYTAAQCPLLPPPLSC